MTNSNWFHIKSLDDHASASALAKSNPEKFWGDIAGEFEFSKKWNKVQSGDFNDLNIKWFEGSELNITVNCLDRHVRTQPNKTALIFEANDPSEKSKSYTYKELLEEVSRFANVLKEMGVKPKDRVCFYMAMTPELLIGVLACARIGATHSVIFGGFSAQAIQGRLEDSGAKFVITNDGGFRGAKPLALKAVVDEAMTLGKHFVEKVLVAKRTGQEVTMKAGRDFWYHELSKNASTECAPTMVDAEHPLFILYTSGSTGKPKGLLHTTAGYMVWAAYTFKNVFQMSAKEDIFWCTADIGWITGHTYLTYGPLLNGETTVMFEGIPTYPDSGRFWQVIEKLKVTHFYTAPTAIRSLMTAPENFITRSNLSSLKVIGSVGEPINEEAWEWYHKKIGGGKCPLVDTWWQTETGGIMISTLAGITPSIPTYATLPLPGIVPKLVDAEGKEIQGSPAEGNLCITQPWPGMARTIWGDHDRFHSTYFSTYKGLYFTGDGSKRDEKSNYRITGRVDDVMNVSGHRIGTAEVEDALDEHHGIIEAAVVGMPHDIKGQGIFAYVILAPDYKKPSDEDFIKEINAVITKVIGPIAKPDKVLVVSGLPKTRSGKIMRRILRKAAEGDFSNFGDISTLVNPEIVEEITSKLKK